MSTLLLRIDKRLDAGRGRAPRIPVKIYPVGKSSANTGKRESSIDAWISISDRDEDATSVTLNPGRYYVESVLPSGETLADDVVVSERDTTRLVLKGEAPAEEWLSWQDFNGNLMAPAPPPARLNLDLLTYGRAHSGRSAMVSIPGQINPGSRRIRVFDRLPDASRGIGGAKLRSSAPRADRVIINAPIGLLTKANPILHSATSPGKVWEWLQELTGSPQEAVISELNRSAPPAPIELFARNTSQAVFRLTSQSIRLKMSLQPNYANERFSRAFVVVPRRRSIELLSLPMPWMTEDSPADATIEVGVTQQRSATAFCSSIVAQDNHFGILLSYLSAGALPTAQAMAEPALDFLRYKYRNPFAAAAGGYALVGTMSRAHEEKWHDWIHNLMISFPSIPDGAILWAQLKLRMGRNKSDVKEASDALKLAYCRGIPFYSMGVKWLMEGLEAISRKDPEAMPMLRAVRAIAWRINYQQPFTILRIAGAPDV
jgi:hypothetical protein